MNWTNVRLIWARELRDQLRDRRTIFSIAVLPLVLYPLMGMMFLQITQFVKEHASQVALLGIESLPDDPPLLAGGAFSPAFHRPDDGLLELRVLDGSAAASDPERVRAWAAAEIQEGRTHAVVHFPPDFARQLNRLREQIRAGQSPGSSREPSETSGSREPSGSRKSASSDPSEVPLQIEILANLADDKSRFAAERVERVLRRWREEIVRQTLRDNRIPQAATEPFRVTGLDVSREAFRHAAVWSKVLPFVVFIWALTGAFYPAIDLCAGEKERGTLETLLCSPALRSEIVWGKLLTVITFSTATALLNLFSLAVTALLLFSRLAEFGQEAPGMAFGAPPLPAIVWLLLTIVPIAALFSGLALAIAAFARSSKEGQYYLMPLLLITLPLMTLPLLPASELDLGSSVIPVTGIMLWLRALIEGEYATAARFAAPVVGVTAICCWLAIRWAERQFQSESVLFRESERFGLRLWAQHLVRDRQDTPSPAEAFGCGLLILMITFIASVRAAPPAGWSGMARMILLTQIGLIAAPALIMTVVLTRRWARTLLLVRPPLLALPAAVLLAVALHPSVVLLGHQIRSLYPLSDEALRAFEPLITAIGQAPWWQVLAAVALAPAICEELAFRGFLLSGLRHLGSTTAAVVISSIFFGLTHGMLQQSLSAISVGLVIGFLAIRTGSLFPCMLFHFTHNSLTILASRFAQEDHGGWLDWLIEETGTSGDFAYRWPAVAASMVLSLLLLAWFYRLPPQPVPADRSDA